MNTPKYFLRSHAFVCPTKRYWLVLDVPCDRYLCIDKQRFDLLGPWLYGWHGQLSSHPQDWKVIPPEADKLAADLIAKGVLTELSEGTKAARPVSLAAPTGVLETTAYDVPLKSRLKHVPAFLTASARANRQLKSQTFEQIVHGVEARKLRNRSPNTPFDFQRAASLTSIFNTLRLLYPRNYLCMFDALALLEFLARYSVFPNWVFGVAADPFKAHCWLQEDEVVLNDTVERASIYTPIMCV